MTTAAIDPRLDLFAEIERLKRARKAVILAHYYQEPDIQDIADHLGDSLDLSRAARDAKDCEVILFCGVHFMAETAKILNPGKTVILPDMDAGCSLADACPADKLAAWKAMHPDHFVITYINSTAAVKLGSGTVPLSEAQRKVLIALCRPLAHSAYATPATNKEIAAEVYLSVDAVKAHLRVIFERFDLDDLPQNQKRARLAATALVNGVVRPHDF